MFGDKVKGTRNGHSVETLIGPRVQIRGDILFAGGLYVEGRILGKVVAVRVTGSKTGYNSVTKSSPPSSNDGSRKLLQSKKFSIP